MTKEQGERIAALEVRVEDFGKALDLLSGKFDSLIWKVIGPVCGVNLGGIILVAFMNSLIR